MSTTIDERVVEMRFDGRQFESAVKPTLSTIDKLKQALNFKDSAKSLDGINDSAKRINMSGLNGAVEAVRLKFSALDVAAVTALANITNSAINAGKNITSALTIDPIKTGFQEYETQINAIQTVLANTESKGTTLKDVNAALAELNTYADKTIYNFTEMTRNIGTFTAAGVDLNTSVSAIKGIANMAAVSGSTSQQASTAMYQLSQALASGTVKLQDWNSVVNAGMGGEVFQSALKETAKVHGVAIDKMIKDEGSFRETLKNGWLTSGVLTETLSKFTGDLNENQLKTMGYSDEQIASIIKMGQTANDAATKVKTFTQLFDTLKEAAQSGWTQSWQIIVGNFEEAKELLTDASNTFGALIGNAANARNELLSGGLSSAWDRFTSVFSEGMGETGLDTYKETIKSVAKEQGIAIDDLITKNGSFEKSLKDGWLTSDIMTESLSKMTSEMGALSDKELEAKGYTRDQINALSEFNTAVQNGTLSVDGLTEAIAKPSGRENIIQALRNSFSALMSVITPVKEAFEEIFPPMTAEQLYNMTVALEKFTSHLALSSEQSDNLKRSFKGLFAIIDIFTTITGGALKVGLKIAAKLFGVTSDNVLDVTASIGDAVVAFRDWLFENNIVVKGLEKLASGLRDGIEIASRWIKNFMALPEVQKNITRFETAFASTLDNLKGYFTGGIDRISAFINRVKAMDSLTLDDVASIFKDFKENVVDYFLDIDGRFDDLKLAVEQFKNDIKKHLESTGDGFDGLKAKIIEFADSVKEKLSGIGLGEILTIGVGASLIFIVKKMGDLVDTISGPIADLSGVLTGLQGVLKAYALQLKANALLKVAGAIAILAASVAVLSLLDQKKLWSSVGALAALAGGLVAISAVMGLLDKFAGFSKASSSMVALATSLLILAVALKKMEELDPDKLNNNVKVLGVMALGLAGVAAILGKVAPQLSKGSIFLLSFATSLKIMVNALADLDKLDSTHIDDSLTILLGAMAGLALVATACRNIKIGSAATVLAIAIALKILVGTFDDISNLDTSKMRTNLEAFVAIFGMFATLMVASKLAGKDAAKVGVAIIAMSAALLIIIKAFKLMADIEPDSLNRALKTVTQLLLVFAAITALSNFAGKNAAKAGVMILMMSGAMLALSIVITILSELDPSGLGRAVAAIVAVEACFALLIGITKIAKDSKSTLIILASTIGLLAIALGTLSMIEPKNLITATAALSSVMVMFALLVASTALARTAIPTLVIMTAVVASLAVMLYVLSDLPVKSTLGIAASLAILLVSLSAACLILSAVGAVAAPALIGIAVLGALIVGVGVLLAAIGALVTYVPQVEEWLDKGIPVLEKIGYALGSFFGNIVGGFASGATANLTEVGTNLSNFITSLEPFFAGVKGIDTDSINGVKALAETILILTGADLLSKLTSWLTGGKSLSAFGDELVLFGGYFKRYAESVSGVTNIDTVTASANATKVLAEMASSLPNAGGLVASVTGENSLSAFGAELVLFGPMLSLYAQSISGLTDISAIEASANATTLLAEMASKIPNAGGLVAAITGENSLSAFGSELVLFGPKIKQYADSVNGLNVDSITNSMTAVEALAAFASAIPNTGGLVAKITGENSLSAFAAELVTFGPSIKAYADSVSGLNSEVVVNSTNAATALSELANNLPNGGGLVSWFTGSNDMSSFGTNLVSFGQSFATYSNYMSTVSADVVNATTSAANSIVELQKALPEKGGIFSKQTTLSSFGSNLASFGMYFNMYYTNISGIDAARVLGIATVTNKLIAMIQNMADLDTSGVSAFGSALTALGKITYADLDAGFADTINHMSDISGKIITAFIDGVNTKKTELKTGVDIIVIALTNSLTEINNKYTDFNKAGSYLIDGFALGISSNSYKVKEAAITMGNIALTGTKEALDIHSPSKVMEKVGNFAGMGLTKGMEGIYSGVKKAGEKLGLGATDGATDGIKTGGKKVSKAAKETAKSVYDITKEWIDERKYYNELSLDDELAKWQEVQAKYKEGTEDRKKIDREVYRVKNEIIANQFKNEKEFIEDEKFYKKASLNDELEYWIKIQEKYNALGDEYDEQRNEADRKVFTLQNDLLEKANAAQKEAAEKAFSNAKSWIDERKYYGELSLKEELYTWEQIQDEYEEGTEKRKEADKEVYRLEQEISKKREEYAKNVADVEKDASDKRIELEQNYYDKTKEINDKLKTDIDDLNAKYNDAVKSRADSLYSAYNMFDHANIGGGVDGKVLIDNLGSQVTALEDWTKDINSLGSRGIASGLLDELKNMGPSSASEIKALNSLTDEQLNQYVALWQQKHDLAKNQAVAELEDMRLKTVSKIVELNASATVELDKYKTTWNNELAQVNANAITKLAELKATFDSEIGSISSETRRKVRDLTDDIESNIVESSDEITGEVTKLTENIQNAMEAPDWVSIGTNIILGIKKGILDKASELAEAAARVASDALEAAKEELDINSPSKKFQMLGRYCDEGFIVGLNAYSGKVSDASASVGSSALDSIKGTIAKISEAVNSGINAQPTIRPVLDLSNIESGASAINALFSRQQAMSISTGLNRSNYDPEIQNGVGTTDKNSTFTMIQNNYSPKALSRVDIYRQTKNQFSAMERMANT